MTTPLRTGDLIAGRYQLERVLGIGGMGVVYRARDLLHEQFGEPCSSVALKVLGECFSECPDAHVLLYSEFSLARSLLHPGVVRMFGFDVDTRRQSAFFTMELMHGMPLDRLMLERPAGFGWHEWQPMALQLLDALAYVHGRGVLHGDVKPGNVMVAEAGIRLFDFGLGQSQAVTGLPGLDRHRISAWTPAYAAPELLSGAQLSATADVYGVACVLYEMAQGRRARERKLTQAPDRPRQLPRHCWSALRAAMAMDPTQRTITVAEVREALSGRSWRWFA
ncbi:serine/threonine-protein kinase [Pseudomonas trivialis]|uniref:Serine/threonine protein kinase n=1 Tax=Pseudomonas trivialis TaxID=200450 RepID=A0A0R2ZCU7_9PSED|nr:serine/threonine-protein kinase [Pseudomonas trivialis]KRP58599.1 serine/threonine protein kinase [Pseudomonas trivialis]SDS76105.1 serine/threonine-protein kinase Stk1 [Pseudomonas trivialis]